MTLRNALAWSALVFLVSCTETTTTSSGFFGDDTTTSRHSLFDPTREVVSTRAGAAPGARIIGTDQFVNQDYGSRQNSQAIVVPRDGSQVELSLVNASVATAAQAVLAEALGRKYVISDQVTGTVTIQSTGPIPKDALFDLFTSALAANGAQIEQSGDVLQIVPGTSGASAYRLASQGVGSGASVVVAPLKFISASQMIRLMDPLISDGLRVVADRNRNLLLLSGPRNLIEAALDSLNLFDVDVLEGKSVALVRLTSGDPEAMVPELQRIFETEEGGNLDGVIEFVPNNELGSILVITSRSTYLARAQRWIQQLDDAARGADRFIVAYELQNRSAAEVAPILNELLSEISADGSSSNSARAAADEARNSLLIRANRTEHAEINNLLAQLDNSPEQVMLEATIAEVTINDEIALGVRWYLASLNLGTTFTDLANGGVSRNYPGFSAVFNGTGVDAAINALSGVTDVKIISSPTLMVLDNQEAVLQIGDQVPIATSSATDTSDASSPVVTTVEYRDTGVILSVQPSINRNGRIVLDVSQEISDVARTSTSGIDSPTIRQRKIATNVLVSDGATLALGGLVQEGDTKTVTKVPGLGDVPVVGALFRETTVNRSRTELLILIRPHVVSNAADAADITDYWRTKLSAADSLLGTGLGSPRHTIGDVLR